MVVASSTQPTAFTPRDGFPLHTSRHMQTCVLGLLRESIFTASVTHKAPRLSAVRIHSLDSPIHCTGDCIDCLPVRSLSKTSVSIFNSLMLWIPATSILFRFCQAIIFWMMWTHPVVCKFWLMEGNSRYDNVGNSNFGETKFKIMFL